ncbi:hypothetical protein DPMN_071173 [Dreissena polymorpha]|uniref:Uncharacterized protein n=1 Tax=Dreissena polymorpha TaxID=45954 RepID=A0A9D3Z431_DREPO|nr:hypothetical protein DPMN_071173 [Dreissena polymorpha]
MKRLVHHNYVITISAIGLLLPLSVQTAAPVFSKPSPLDQQTSCFENIASSSSIYRVSASDADGDTVTVAIHSQNPSEPPFQLAKAIIGWNLKTPASTTIDRETTPTFTFVFNASDGNNTVQSVTLTLILTDLNDNSPHFTQSAYRVDPHLLTIRATDADVSNTINYVIKEPIPNNMFSIDINTGQIILKTFTFTVEASDGTHVNTTTVATGTVVGQPCNSSPCLNSGTCSTNGADFACTCTLGWLGKTCNITDPCIPSPCSNGTCYKSGSNYTCLCTEGWFGDTCNQVNPCESSPCSNGGTCYVMARNSPVPVIQVGSGKDVVQRIRVFHRLAAMVLVIETDLITNARAMKVGSGTIVTKRIRVFHRLAAMERVIKADQITHALAMTVGSGTHVTKRIRVFHHLAAMERVIEADPILHARAMKVGSETHVTKSSHEYNSSTEKKSGDYLFPIYIVIPVVGIPALILYSALLVHIFHHKWRRNQLEDRTKH